MKIKYEKSKNEKEKKRNITHDIKYSVGHEKSQTRTVLHR